MNSPFVSDGITENCHGFCLCRIYFFFWLLFFLVSRWHLHFCVYCVPYNVILTTRSSFVSQDSVDGIATRYGLDDLGIESRWVQDFSAPVRNGPGAHQYSYTKGTVLFPGVNLPGRCVYHPPPSSTEVKERVELYLYSPSDRWWHVLVWNLPFIIYILVIFRIV